MGTYEAGKALTNENTVELELDIIEPGAFNISTETLDGILFSNSGTFTRKGIQTVILKGSGVQIQPMTLDFKPMSSTTECTFRVTVAYPGPPGPQATYVLVSSAGTPPLCFYQINGVYTTGTALNETNTITMNVYVTLVGNFTIATEVVNGISFFYTGTFTKTGGQNVTLTGTGNPLMIGKIDLAPHIVGQHPLGGEACAIAIPVK